MLAARGDSRLRSGAARGPVRDIDGQSVQGADLLGRATRSYDGSRKVKNRKPSIVTDTMGLLIVVVVLASSVQRRDGASGRNETQVIG